MLRDLTNIVQEKLIKETIFLLVCYLSIDLMPCKAYSIYDMMSQPARKVITGGFLLFQQIKLEKSVPLRAVKHSTEIG